MILWQLWYDFSAAKNIKDTNKVLREGISDYWKNHGINPITNLATLIEPGEDKGEAVKPVEQEKPSIDTNKPMDPTIDNINTDKPEISNPDNNSNNEENKKLAIDKDLLIAYYKSLQEINTTIKSVDKKAKLKNISLIDLANFQGVINLADDSLDLEAIKPLLVAKVEKATEKFILNMHKKGYTLEQIADVAEISVDAVEAVIQKKAPVMA